MRSQTARDEQTVTIATTLALLLAALVVGVAALWLLTMTTDLSAQTENTIFIATWAVAVLGSGRYLIRHRRPSPEQGHPSDAHKLS